MSVAWDPELRAAKVLEAAGTADAWQRAVGRDQQSDLHASTHRGSIAIEVTRLNVQRSLKMRSAINRMDWRESGLENDWAVVRPGLREKTLRRHAETPLCERKRRSAAEERRP